MPHADVYATNYYGYNNYGYNNYGYNNYGYNNYGYNNYDYNNYGTTGVGAVARPYGDQVCRCCGINLYSYILPSLFLLISSFFLALVV